jgi:general secretion pathway protein D
MKRFTRVLAVLLMGAILPAVASNDKAAKVLYQKGKDAEIRQDYIAAYNFYHQAYQLKPSDLTYRASFEYVRFLASASYVHQGEILVKAGKLQEALTDFEQALGIDPSSFIAQQEANKTRLLIRKSQNPSPPAPTTESGLTKRMEDAAGPVELAPISQTPITLKLTEDAKTVYETIGKLAGVNVLFDPDYTSRRIRVDLNGVTLEEALEITALESKTFWRPVTPNTIFVAADTPAKRKELEQSVIRTFYLTNLSQPNELQDLVNILRTLLDTQRLQQFPSQQAIVVRGTPDQIAMAEKLINDLDKGRPEVVVEVAIMQVTRDKMRNLGIQPPASISVQLQQNVPTTSSTTVAGNAGNGGTATTTTGTAGSISLNSLANLNATNFQVTIPAATANFLMSDSSSKLITQPQIRASDGQKASLKIGERIPVATGSFQPGIGGVGINPLVNTQFNYIDVGVNIDITPRVHGFDEVTLKMSMDVSAVDSFQNIGGIQQPVIGQRKIEQEIRLREGEVNILGGILENDQTKSLSGIPGLASIPIFKYLFASESKENKDNEIVFILIPHIVRAQDLNDSNVKAIDVGTANTISLHHGMTEAPDQQQHGAPPPGTAGNPQGAQIAPSQPQASAAPATGAQPSTASAPPGSAIVSFDPPMLDQAVGSTFTVNVNLTGGQNVYSVPVQILYNPRVLQVLNVSNGTLLAQDGQTVALVNRDDSMAGILQLTASRPPGSAGISGDGSVFTITFQAKAPGQATLSVNRAGVKNASMQNVPASGSQSIVTVH